MIRQQLRSHLDTALLPVFERAFDEWTDALGAGGEVVRIPRLVFDLKLRSNGDFITMLTDELRKKLDEVLQDACISHPQQTGVQRLPVSALLRGTLLNYLSTGVLAWHDYGTRQADTFLQTLRGEAVALSHEKSALFDAVSGSWEQRNAASFRLLQLLPDESRLALMALAPIDTLASLTTLTPADAAQLPNRLPGLLRALASSGALAKIIDGYLLLRVQAMLLAIRPEDLRRPLASPIVALLHECLRQARADAPVIGALPDSANETFLKTGKQGIPANEMPPVIAVYPPPVRLSEKSSGAGYLAGDAGLILLHPFLPCLFDALGITPAGTVALPEAMLPRAAALLHWLLSGREEVYEFELTLIKVLLGIPPNQILPVAGGLLNEADKIESDALLAAAVAHWAALGKTSAAALRSTFLQRRGLLRDSDSGWQLQVEAESFDLLLGKLPWSISIVRLPWMSRPIFTEWITP